MSADERQAARLSGQALREARERIDLTQAGLASRVGVSVSTVQRWEQGDRPPPATKRALLRDILGLAGAGGGDVAERGAPYRASVGSLPLYGMGHIAGSTDAEPEIIDRVRVSGREQALADALVRIHGTSMEPTFISGDVVGIKLQHSALPEQVILAVADGELTLKVYGGEVGGKGLLLPLNTSHRPIVADDLRILGVYRFLKRDSKDGRA